MKELIESVKATEKTKSIWRSNPNSNEWQNANKLNRLLFGIPLNSSAKCECIEDLFFMLKRENVEQKIIITMEKKFILKKGKLIQSSKFGHIGEQTSDEVMIKALTDSPALIKHFKSVPEDWKKICSVKEEKKTNSERPTSPEERKSEKTTSESKSASIDLSSLKVSELRSIITKKGVEIPKEVNRKDELIDFIKKNSIA